MTNAQRIDVHQHVIPAIFAQELDSRGMSAMAPRAWSPAGALTMMDNHGVATGILSLSAPGCHFGDDGHARKLARAVNEEQAELVKDKPDRFGMFAAVPLPDIDGALEAIAYSYDELGADGVVLLANNRQIYLGDPTYEPVMAELDRRDAVVFIHPNVLPGPMVDGVFPAVVDFLLDTTRAAMNLVLRGVPKRYPHLKMILSHGGGFVPYAAHRAAIVASLVDPSQDPADLLNELAGFYFDTALSSSPSALPSLLAFAQPGHVLFGTDSPYAPESAISYFTDHFDTYQPIEQDQRDAINRRTAEALFPRLAGKTA